MAATASINTPEKLAEILEFVNLLEKHRDGIITPDQEVRLLDVSWSMTDNAEAVERIFTDPDYVIELIQRFRHSHSEWLNRETTNFPVPDTPPTVPEDCNICYGEHGNVQKCCTGVICKSCRDRTENCPFCRKQYSSPERNPMLMQERLKQQRLTDIKHRAIDEVSMELSRVYHMDIQDALETTTKYYDFFEPSIDVLPEYELEDSYNILRRFRIFVAALSARQRLEPEFYNERRAVSDALNIAISDEYEIWEMTYLSMAGFV